MRQAETAPITFRPFDAAEIAAKNERARIAIGREVEELLRIRREADEAAFRLITLLDLDEPDPDLEPSFGGGGYGDDGMEREADTADDEPSLGWTHTPNQASRRWHGMPPMTGAFAWGVPIDAEAEHDGREPSLGAPETGLPPDRPITWASGIDRRYSQEHWAGGDPRDLEAEHDGREPDDEDVEDNGTEDCDLQYHGGNDLGMVRKAVAS